MPAHIWLFYAVVLSQVFLVSFVFPRQLLSRVRSVVETYPPSTYPKLYPVPVEDVEKAQRTYKHLNTFALLAGLILVSTSVYTRRIEMLNWDSQAVLFLYTVLQLSPHVFAARLVGKNFKRMRQVNPRTIRKADLHPRRLFDFMSPTFTKLVMLLSVASRIGSTTAIRPSSGTLALSKASLANTKSSNRIMLLVPLAIQR